jgi:Flp pilus assembly protein TadG
MKMVRQHTMRGERGVAMVEFVLALPLLTLLLLGCVEVGRYAYFSIIVANAARAGVQYAAQNNQTAVDGTGINAAVQADGTNSISAVTTTETTSCECWNGSTASQVTSPCTSLPTCASGAHQVEYVSVTASGTAHPLFNYPLLPGALTVRSTATQRILQ